MKNKMIFIVVTLIIITSLVGCGEKKEKLNVYNWFDYIDPDVVKDFEKEFDVKIVYDAFATNEDLYMKIKQGGSSYDVIFPSDYMIERMIREDLIVKIDKTNIPNLDKIGKDFLDLDYDMDNDYSIPYMWGTVGIIYNTTKVDDIVDSWDILWNEKYKDEIIMLDSQRDTIGITLKKLGYSLNTRDTSELEEAKAELIRQKSLVYSYMGDEVKDAIIGSEAAMAIVWSGDAVAMIRENPDLAYAVPKEGTNLWFDAMVIPKSTTNKELAEEFINFLTRPDISARNADYIGYSTPIPESVELLPDDMKNSEVAYPNLDDLSDLEIFRDPMDIIQIYDKIWTDLKSEK